MYSVKPKIFRYCAVPQCESTTIETPTKLFIALPPKGRLRDQWLKLARRDPNSLHRYTRLYFCQDHFDLPRDMKNFDDYCMGYASQIQLKNYCVPSKFECQTGKEGDKQKELLNVKSYQGRKKASSAKSTTTSKSVPGETSGAKTDEGCLKLNVSMDVVDSAGHMTGEKYCFCCLSYKCSLISTSNCSHYDHYIKYMDVKNLNSDHHVCLMCHQMLKKIEQFNNMVIESNHTIASKLDITNSRKKEFIDLQISTTPTSIETLYHVSISTQHMEPDFTLPVRKRPNLTKNKIQKSKPNIITNHSLPVTKHKIVVNDKLQEIVPVERSDNIIPVIKHEIVDEDFIDDSCLHFENIPVKIEPFSTSVLSEIEILPELPVKQETKEISPQFEGKVGYVCLSREEYEKEREVLESTDHVYRSSEFRCKSCVIGFPNLNKYQTHLNLDHGYSDKLLNKVQCTICDLLVDPPLVEHERTHFSRTAYNCTMEKQPDEPEDVTNELLPSMSDPMDAQDAVASTFTQSIIAASKSKAQKQREYRQRIAASRTAAQAAVARKSKNERQRKNRLRQAANLAIASSLEATTTSSSRSGEESSNASEASISAAPFAEPITAAPKTRAQIQREYRQRIAAYRTPAQAAAAREARNVRDRNNRLRQAANLVIASGSREATTTSSSRSGQRLNTVYIDTRRQFTDQQR